MAASMELLDFGGAVAHRPCGHSWPSGWRPVGFTNDQQGMTVGGRPGSQGSGDGATLSRIWWRKTLATLKT